jgi:hypothetical protein
VELFGELFARFVNGNVEAVKTSVSFGEERGRAFDEDEAERADGIRIFVGRAAQVLEACHGHSRGARAELEQPRAVDVVHRAHDRPEPRDELCVRAKKSSDKKPCESWNVR